jgi:hypothetical protein
MLRTALATCLVLTASACVTPSLPVPPPEPGLLAFHLDTSSGQATYHAAADPDWANAKVSVYDEHSGRGVITTANPDGSVSETPPFPAGDGDRVLVLYELPDQSAGHCLILHDGPSRPDFLCQ